MTKKEKILLFILASINFTHILDFMIMMPLNPLLSETFKISQQQFNLLVSSYAISACISGLIAAFFVDRFDRKSILLFGYIGFIIGTFCCAIAPNYSLLMSARIVAGLFGGLIGAQVLSIVGDVFPYEKRGTAMGFLSTAFAVASIFGVPFSLYVASITSWHAPFFIVGGLGIMIAIFVLIYIPSMTQHLQSGIKHKPTDAFRNVLQQKNLQLALFFSFLFMLGHFSLIPTISAYMVHNVGLTKEQLPSIYLAGGIATLFTAPIVGKLADKKGKYFMFAIFAALCIIPVFLITQLPEVSLFIALTITTLFFIFVNGRMIPMQAMISSVAIPQQRGGFMSINSSIIQLGTGASGILSGFILSETTTGKILNYQYVGYFAIAMSIICIFLARNIKAVDQK